MSWDRPVSRSGDIFLAHMVYESRTKLNVDGTVEPNHCWDISDDGLTYTFNLRKGVKGHHDYANSIRKTLNLPLKACRSDVGSMPKIST